MTVFDVMLSHLYRVDFNYGKDMAKIKYGRLASQ